MKVMYYYNKLRQTNPKLAKTKHGRSMLMGEAVLTARVYPTLKLANEIAMNIARIIYPFSNIKING